MMRDTGPRWLFAPAQGEAWGKGLTPVAAFIIVISTGKGGGHVGSPWQGKDRSGISWNPVTQQRGGEDNGE